MRRALELADKGAGRVSPNPLVGCVVAVGDRVLGEGYHEKYGGPHAEVNAFAAISDREAIAEATAYVTLEPCNHFGRTPPCTDLLLKERPARVVVAMQDPNPQVAGKGLARLREAGIPVEVGLLEEEARWLNRRFLSFHVRKRPYVILKWAQTFDGFIARVDGSSKWISSEESRRTVHQWRAEEDAILIGSMTARVDDPHLNVRYGIEGLDPVRCVIDRDLRLSPHLNLFNQVQPTLVYNGLEDRAQEAVQFVKLPFKLPIKELLADLHRRKVLSLIVEGGTKTVASFQRAGLWDEARIFTAPAVFEAGITAPSTEGLLVEDATSGPDRLQVWLNSSAR